MNFKISFKNSIRKAIKVLLILLTPYAFVAQNVNLETDKLIYEFNDEILVQASVDAKFDSVKMSAFENVKSISKAKLSSQSSSIKGQLGIKQTISYRLRPLDSGRIEIKSPTFYFNGKEVIGESIFITITSSKLSENDFSIDGQNITITLPRAQLQYINIKPEDIKTAYEEISFFRTKFTSQEKNELAIQAEKQIKESVPSLGILVTAETNATLFVDNFLKNLGYKNINIHFSTPKKPLP